MRLKSYNKRELKKDKYERFFFFFMELNLRVLNKVEKFVRGEKGGKTYTWVVDNFNVLLYGYM